MNLHKHLGAALGLLVLSACEETPSTPVQDNLVTESFKANFDPGADDPVIPFPNNVLFNGSVDGTLEIPVPALDTTTCPNAGEIAVKTALNDLDGFSTTAPISTTFSSAVDSNSLVIGDSVRVFEVTLTGTGGAVTGITRELANDEITASGSSVDNEIQDANCDTASPGANKLVILPLKPLKPKTSYLVVLNNNIIGENGGHAVADLVYAFTKSNDALVSTFPPASLADINYTGLTSEVDTNNDDVIDVDVNGDGTIDTADYTEFLTSIASLEGCDN